MEERNEVTEEFALEEFARILKAARVKWNIFSLANEDKDSDVIKAVLIDAIMDGRITVNDEGFPTVLPETDNERIKRVVFKRRLISADSFMTGGGSDEQRMLRAWGKFFGIAPSELEKLEPTDMNLVLYLWKIFLGH